jgi:hypothetical protein
LTAADEVTVSGGHLSSIDGVVTVSAGDFQIRALTYEDSITVSGGRALHYETDSVTISGFTVQEIDHITTLDTITNPVTVSAADFQIRLLTAADEVTVQAIGLDIRQLTGSDEVTVANKYDDQQIWPDASVFYDSSVTDAFNIQGYPVFNIFGDLTGLSESVTFRLQVSSDNDTWQNTARTIVVTGDESNNGILEYTANDIAARHVRLIKLAGSECSGGIIAVGRSA